MYYVCVHCTTVKFFKLLVSCNISGFTSLDQLAVAQQRFFSGGGDGHIINYCKSARRSGTRHYKVMS